MAGRKFKKVQRNGGKGAPLLQPEPPVQTVSFLRCRLSRALVVGVRLGKNKIEWREVRLPVPSSCDLSSPFSILHQYSWPLAILIYLYDDFTSRQQRTEQRAPPCWPYRATQRTNPKMAAEDSNLSISPRPSLPALRDLATEHPLRSRESPCQYCSLDPMQW